MANINPGLDGSGNGNNWAPVNINFYTSSSTTYDVMTDVPTNTSATTANYAVLNPLSKGSGVVLTAGNLNYGDPTDTSNCGAFSTIGMTSGKWYCEATITGTDVMVGLSSNQVGSIGYVGSTAFGWGYYSSNGQKYNNGSGSAYGATYTTNDVIGIAFDADNGTLTFYKNNTSQGTAYTGLTSGPYYFATGNGAGGTDGSLVFNFGQRPFTYTPPANYVALNTYNLPTPTIGATATTQANKYFDATLYTGTGSTLAVTNTAGFQPDWVWLKNRSSAAFHSLWDSVRGRSAGGLATNDTMAEQSSTAGNDFVSFNSNGFSVGPNQNWNVDTNTASYVAWQWNAGGSTVTNTSGTISAQVRANTTSGFSVVTYSGTGSAATVGHGLGVAPKMIIVKRRNTAQSWPVYHASLGATKNLYLDLTDAAATATAPWNDTSPTSTVFTVGTSAATNSGSGTYVAYCFAEIAGFSKFGSYTGNGSSDGTFVYTGFMPRFIVWKNATTSATSWMMMDTARSTYNAVNAQLNPNTSDAESTASAINCDYLSNGFKLRGTSSNFNLNGDTIVFMAFAESPFKYANAR